jgi:Glycosyl transferase family 2
MESKRLQVLVNPSIQIPESAPPLVTIPPSLNCEVCVIVPVRNEAQTLIATLTALASQTELTGERLDPTRYEIILLANNCDDNSAAIARDFASQHPDLKLHVVEKTLSPQQAYIGYVRKILMDEAYRRLRKYRGGVIASTDGDSQVSPTWIAANLYEIACGADAVGGRIITDTAGRSELHPYAKACHLREVGYNYLVAELETYLDPNPHDPFPRHYQHYGASFAVTVQMYARSGGMPLVRTPEDVAFYQALMQVNARFRHSPLVRVVTSARQTGRTNIGLANQLQKWTTMGEENQPFLVESAEAIATRLLSRHQLRLLWSSILSGYQPTQSDILPLAKKLRINAQWLTQELTQPTTSGKLIEIVEQRQHQEGMWTQQWKLIDIRQAIKDLREYLAPLRQQNNHLHQWVRPSLPNQIASAMISSKKLDKSA